MILRDEFVRVAAPENGFGALSKMLQIVIFIISCGESVLEQVCIVEGLDLALIVG